MNLATVGGQGALFAASGDDRRPPCDVPRDRAPLEHRRADLSAAAAPAGLPGRSDVLAAPAGGYEVVVVYDGGTHPLEQIVAGQRQAPVRLHRQRNAGPAAARNAGLELARGRRVAFTDDDCAPRSEWLIELDAALDGQPGSLVGGHTVNALTDDPWAEASQQLVDHLYAWQFEHGRGRFFTSNNIAAEAQGLRAVAGFDGRFPGAAAEDRELASRWLAAGRPLRHAPRAVVEHSHAMTLRSFWRQHAGYGRGADVFHLIESTRGGTGPRPEPLAFYLGMVRRPFRALPLRCAVPVSALVALSQLATATGYLVERGRRWSAGRRPPRGGASAA